MHSPDAASLDALELLRPERYVREGYPHAAWARLRREAPVHRFERGAGIPFWAVVRHAPSPRAALPRAERARSV